MSILARLTKLEKTHPPEKKKYMCAIIEYSDKPEPETFTAQPFGGNGKNIVFSTRAELDAFGARPDIDLEVVNVVIEYVSTTDAEGEHERKGTYT